MAAVAGNVVAEMIVPVRGDLSPLRADLAMARAELEAFTKSVGASANIGAGGKGGGAAASAAAMATELQAANDNARALATSFTQMGGTATASFASATVGAEQLSGSISTATMDFSAFSKQVALAADETSGLAPALNSAGAAALMTTTEMDRLRASFDPMFASSKRYEATLSDINLALERQVINDRQATVAIDQLNNEYTKAAKSAMMFNEEAGGGHGGHGAMGGLDTTRVMALTHAMRGFGEQIALGVSPVRALTSELAHLSYVASGPGGVAGVFKAVGSFILSVITKFPLAAAGVVVLAGAFIGMHKEIYNGGHKLIEYGDIFTGLMKTIWDGLKSVGDGHDSFFKFMSDSWTKFLSDLKSIGNDIIKSFTDVYNDIKFLFQALPVVIAMGIASATNMVIDGVNFMTKTVIDSINSISEVMNNWLAKIPGNKASFGMLDASAGQISDRADSSSLNKQLGDLAKQRNSTHNEIENSDPLGEFNKAWEANSIEAMQKRLDAKKKKTKATKEDPYEKIIQNANQFIETQNREAEALGMSEQAAANAKYEQQLLNKAADDHIKLTLTQVTALRALGDEMAAAEVRTKKLTALYTEGKADFQGFFTDMASGLQNGSSLWTSFGTAAANALQKIASKALDMATSGIWDMIWGSTGSATGGSSGLGGLLSGLLGGGASVGTSATSSWATGLLNFHATGTPYAAGGLSIVGENGPELMRLSGGEQIIPNNQIHVPNGYSSGNSGQSNGPPHINVNVVGATGNSEIHDMVASGVSTGLKMYDKHTLPKSVERVNANPRMRG